MADVNKLGADDVQAVVARRWPLIVLCTLSLLALALWLDSGRELVYEGQTSVLVSSTAAQEAGDRGTSNPATLARQLENEIRRAESDRTSELVRSKLLLEVDADLPEGEVTPSASSDVLLFMFEADNPEDAALFSDTWAEAYTQVRRTEAQENIIEVTQEINARLEDLREERDLLLTDLQELEDRLVDATEDDRPQIQLEIERERSSISGDLSIIEAQIDSNIRSITDLQINSSLSIAGAARIVEKSELPEDPTGPSRPQIIALSIVVGLTIGLGVAVLVHSLDRRIYSLEDIRKLDFPVIGDVPRASRALRRSGLSFASRDAPKSAVASSYQRSRTAITFSAGDDSALRTMLITSPTKSNGKTTSAFNLALTFALSGRKTVVVDVDLRRPRIHDVAAIPKSPGVTEVITNQLDAAGAAHALDVTSGHPLSVVPAGASVADPTALLSSDRFVEVIKSLGANHDLTILDAPPVLSVADAPAMAATVDGIVLVVRARKTTTTQLLEAASVLQRAHGHLLGVILVGTRSGGDHYQYEKPRSGWKRLPKTAAPERPAVVGEPRVPAQSNAPEEKAAPNEAARKAGSGVFGPSSPAVTGQMRVVDLTNDLPSELADIRFEAPGGDDIVSYPTPAVGQPAENGRHDEVPLFAPAIPPSMTANGNGAQQDDGQQNGIQQNGEHSNGAYHGDELDSGVAVAQPSLNGPPHNGPNSGTPEQSGDIGPQSRDALLDLDFADLTDEDEPAWRWGEGQSR